jgi:outer membrane protein assembly factor BamE (lipoprotein component of BamABCDE complex)
MDAGRDFSITQTSTVMKTRYFVLIALSLLALTGCESLPETSDIAVRSGMSRDDLRLHFGEPLRVEPAGSGGEDWYYRFVTWSNGPAPESGATEDFRGGERISTVTVGWQVNRDSDERPIHVSSEGFVIEPLPNGKIVKK